MTTDRSPRRRCAASAWASAARIDYGTMCPSYMVTREEEHSTRGRARLLWEMLQGEAIRGGWNDEQVKRSLDLCLSCKACKSECPTNVDIATYRAEFLSHYYERRPRPLHAHVFGMIDQWARRRVGGAAPRESRVSAAARHARRCSGSHAQPALPRFARESFVRWAQRDGVPTLTIVASTLQADRDPRRSSSVHGHLQQLLHARNERSRRWPCCGGADSTSSIPGGHALLRPAAVRLRLPRRGEAVPAQRHATRLAPAIDAGVPDRRSRAELRVGVSRRAAQPVSRPTRARAPAPADVSAERVPRTPAARLRAAADRRAACCCTATAITRR